MSGYDLLAVPGVSVHLLKEFVGGVFIAVVLHLVELPLLWRQHGVDLLGERRQMQYLLNTTLLKVHIV